MERSRIAKRGGIALLGALALILLTRAGTAPPNHSEAALEYVSQFQKSRLNGASLVAFFVTEDHVTFSNYDGYWTVWLRHAVDPATGATVGPGYIGEFVRPNGEIIVNDFSSNDPNINDPQRGGLGAFGVQLARENEFYPNGDIYRFTWNLTERMDAKTNNGLGVTDTRILDGPRINDAGSGVLVIENDLSDIYSYPKPIFRVKRTYQFDASSVSVLTTVTVLWDGSGPELFIKEPKLVAHSLGWTDPRSPSYRYLDVFDAAGTRLDRRDLWKLPSPGVKTYQIRTANRYRVRFDDPSRGHLYFNVITTASDGEKLYPWMYSAYGFDKWAQDANAREALLDTAPKYCLQGPLSEPNGSQTLTRNWEATRWASGKAGSPPPQDRPQVGVMFHAWEGGKGYPDCLSASREAGPQGSSYSVWTRYSYDDGWQT